MALVLRMRSILSLLWRFCLNLSWGDCTCDLLTGHRVYCEAGVRMRNVLLLTSGQIWDHFKSLLDHSFPVCVWLGCWVIVVFAPTVFLLTLFNLSWLWMFSSHLMSFDTIDQTVVYQTNNKQKRWENVFTVNLTRIRLGKMSLYSGFAAVLPSCSIWKRLEKTQLKGCGTFYTKSLKTISNFKRAHALFI